MSTEKATISKIVIKSKKQTAPVLMQFQNGEKTNNDTNEINYFPAIDKKRNDKKLAVVATSSAVYRGYIDEGYPVDLIDTFIAIRNKKTNKVRLVQLEQASMFNTIYDEIDSGFGNQFSNTSNNLMFKKFGGRKENRYLDRIEKMKVNVDVVQNQLEKTVDDVNIDSDNEEQMNDDQRNEIRPPHNKNASRLDQIYKFNDIIPQDLLDRLEEESNAVLKTKIENLPITSEYILGQIKEIQNSDNSKSVKNLNSLKCLIYMDALITLIKVRRKYIDRNNLSNITEKVENDIRTRFLQPEISTMMRTTYTTNKAICYFLVLALLRSKNFEIDMNILSQELSISRAKIVKYAHYVCAKQKGKSGLLTFILPKNMKALSAGFKKLKY